MGPVLPLNNPKTGSIVGKVDVLDAVIQTILFGEAIQLLVGDAYCAHLARNLAYISCGKEC